MCSSSSRLLLEDHFLGFGNKLGGDGHRHHHHHQQYLPPTGVQVHVRRVVDPSPPTSPTTKRTIINHNKCFVGGASSSLAAILHLNKFGRGGIIINSSSIVTTRRLSSSSSSSLESNDEGTSTTTTTTTTTKATNGTEARTGDDDNDKEKDKDIKEKTTTTTTTKKRKTYSKYQARPWEEYYEALVDFYKEQGHCTVQYWTIAKTDPSLAYFVKKTRYDGKEQLTPQQIKKLDDIGFNWERKNDKLERIWLERYNQLVDYQHEMGDCNVPTRYVANPTLGRWVDRQRRLYKLRDLPKHRQELLDQIGFKWIVNSTTFATPLARDTSTYDKKWNKQYRKLVDFVRHHGHCVWSPPVRGKNDDDDDSSSSLRNWILAQRGLERKGLLRYDRKEQLKKIGFVFGDIDNSNPRESLYQQKWDEMFQQLLKYRNEHGHVNVPHAYKGHFGLGGWVAVQRRKYKQGVLEDVRYKRLQEVEFEFGTGRDRKWQIMYERLKEYHNQHGHTLCTRQGRGGGGEEDNDDPTLASWVFYQRSMYRQGKLSEKRIKKLESLGFVWQLRNRKAATVNKETKNSK